MPRPQPPRQRTLVTLVDAEQAMARPGCDRQDKQDSSAAQCAVNLWAPRPWPWEDSPMAAKGTTATLVQFSTQTIPLLAALMLSSSQIGAVAVAGLLELPLVHMRRTGLRIY
eukprot:1644742-Amphidinium_carterae.2